MKPIKEKIKPLPIGVNDFKELRKRDLYFIDKTLFIKEILESGTKVNLFPRPRCFGKTLNMTMSRYFFENTNQEENRKLFENTAITSELLFNNKFGKYPVIFFI